MSHRSPARWLAPLALLGAVLAVFLVARPESESTSGSGGSTQAGQTSTSRTTTTKKKSAAKARTYTVKAGDVLSAIAEKTGLTLQRLQELNPDVDANALRTGQKLKLAPSAQ